MAHPTGESGSDAVRLDFAERLRHDPAMRWIVGGKAAQGCAASPSQMGRFETQWLAAPENLSAIADLSGQWIDLVHGRRPCRDPARWPNLQTTFFSRAGRAEGGA
jgi:hypothetical protein